MPSSIHPPVALVTGAAKRIGLAMATHLHRLGYNLIIHYGQSEALATSQVTRFNHLRANSAVAISANLTDIEDVHRLAKQSIKEWGQIDVLINNASSFYPTPFGHIQQEDWTSLVGSNVQGPLFLSQALADTLKKQQGCIINMVDMHIDRPLPKHSVYSLAKGALATLTKSLAIEMAPDVRVNGIAPGAILWPERPLSEQDKLTMLDSIPMGTLGSCEDITHAMEYLLGASYVTGQILYVDGGRGLHTGTPA
ncbi:pteridine reductase [Alteromonas sp. 345S023]|uniref:Pteridine reductase n=1 Tax=Alteromonas profundi TaxID=2696062 RepID=A0A7X5RJV1_9ALTE|nr:pteridine reductase [Alteromonas profundi]NDV89939.1 pteridine reductase [Alteromonas profundi]